MNLGKFFDKFWSNPCTSRFPIIPSIQLSWSTTWNLAKRHMLQGVKRLDFFKINQKHSPKGGYVKNGHIWDFMPNFLFFPIATSPLVVLRTFEKKIIFAVYQTGDVIWKRHFFPIKPKHSKSARITVISHLYTATHNCGLIRPFESKIYCPLGSFRPNFEKCQNSVNNLEIWKT